MFHVRLVRASDSVQLHAAKTVVRNPHPTPLPPSPHQEVRYGIWSLHGIHYMGQSSELSTVKGRLLGMLSCIPAVNS